MVCAWCATVSSLLDEAFPKKLGAIVLLPHCLGQKNNTQITHDTANSSSGKIMKSMSVWDISQIEDMFASNLFAQFLLTQQLGDSSDTSRHEALSLIESNHLRENRRSPCSATVQRCALATLLCPKFSVYKCCLQSCTSTNICHYDEALQISSE